MDSRESIYSEFRFVREWTYLWLDYLTRLQAEYLGAIRVQKATGPGNIWRWLKGIPKKFVGQLGDRPRGPTTPGIQITPQGPSGSFEEAEESIFNALDDDWNKVYQGEIYKGTVLGMIAEEFIRQGYDLNKLKDLTLPDLHSEMKAKGDSGLDELHEWLDRKGWKKSQYYAHIWAQQEGSKWLAVYNDDGERSGRAYELITGMYRQVISEAIEKDKTLDQIRQELLFADDTAIKNSFVNPKTGVLDEDAYQEFIERHLSRDMIRFAVTEAAYAFNNGKLLQIIHEGGEYAIFTGGGMRL